MGLARLVEFDGKVPVWSLICLAVAQVAYGYDRLTMLDKRVELAEAVSLQYRGMVDRLVQDQREVGIMRGDIGTLKELVLRVERKLDNPAR